jgi:hypothetical protein
MTPTVKSHIDFLQKLIEHDYPTPMTKEVFQYVSQQTENGELHHHLCATDGRHAVSIETNELVELNDAPPALTALMSPPWVPFTLTCKLSALKNFAGDPRWPDPNKEITYTTCENCQGVGELLEHCKWCEHDNINECEECDGQGKVSDKEPYWPNPIDTGWINNVLVDRVRLARVLSHFDNDTEVKLMLQGTAKPVWIISPNEWQVLVMPVRPEEKDKGRPCLKLE